MPVEPLPFARCNSGQRELVAAELHVMNFVEWKQIRAMSSPERSGIMEKHISLVGILNIVYRAFVLLGAVVLFVLAALFGQLIEALVRWGSIQPGEVPIEILNIAPIILCLVATMLVVVSVVAIIGAVGVMHKREWARVLLIVISFLGLVRVPLGTILGVYSIWVLLNDETIKQFNPGIQAVGPAT